MDKDSRTIMINEAREAIGHLRLRIGDSLEVFRRLIRRILENFLFPGGFYPKRRMVGNFILDPKLLLLTFL